MADGNIVRERYRLKQHGIPVAWAEGPQASLVIMHYAMVYRQDGAVFIEHREGGRWHKWPPAPSSGRLSPHQQGMG